MKTNIFNIDLKTTGNKWLSRGVVQYNSRNLSLHPMAKVIMLLSIMCLFAVGQVTATDLYVRGDRNSWGTSEKMTGTSSPWTFIAYWNTNSAFKIADSNWGSINLGGASITNFSDKYKMTSGGGNMYFPSLPSDGGLYKITVTLESGSYYIKVDRLVEEGSTAYNITATSHIYFNTSNATSTYSAASILLGKSNGSQDYAMTKITNTDLFYKAMSSWSGFKTFLFINANNWGGNWSGEKVTQRITGATNTNSYNTNLAAKYHMFTATSGDDNAALSYTSETGYAALLNKTQTVQVRVSENNGVSYSNAAFSSWPGTINVARTYMSSASASSSPAATAMTSATTSAVITSSISFTGASTTAYTFAGWSDSNSSPDGNTSKTYKVTGATIKYAFYKRKQFSVTFAPKGTYGTSTLAASINSSAITSGSNYNYGSTIVFTATPATGYEIEGWYSNEACTTSLNNGTANTYTINSLTSAKTVYVKFREKTYTVSFTNDGHGTTTPSSNQTVGQLAGVSINATPSAGFRFSNWEITSGTGTFANAATTASNTFYPTSAATIKANFEETALSLSVATGTQTGYTRVHAFWLGDILYLKANVSDLPTSPYTVTFYDNAENVLGTASATAPSSASFNSSSVWSDYSTPTPTFKAKITGGAGGYRSSTFATTTLYIATPIVKTLTLKNATTDENLSSPASIVLGNSIRVYGACDSVKRTNTAIQIVVTGPSPANTYTYSTDEGLLPGALNYGYTCTPEAIGTYNLTVNLKHNGVTVASRNSSFTVTERTHTVAVAVADGQTSWGSVSPTSVTAGEENFNSSITATAVTNRGYAFDKWTYDSGITLKNAATNATQQIKANADGLTLTANFKTTQRYSTIYLPGSMNSWNTSSNAWRFEIPVGALESDNTVTLKKTINKYDYASSSYQIGFKIYQSTWGIKWWTNSGAGDTKMDAHNCTNWEMFTSACNDGVGSCNTTLDLNVSGEYTFTLTNCNSSSAQRLSITYPDKSFIEGDFASSWDEDAYPLVEVGNIQSVTIPITSCKNVEFRLVSHGKLFGNNTTVGTTGATITNGTNSKTLSAMNMQSAGATMKIGAYVAGDYTFSYNKSTKLLTVTWPTVNQLQIYNSTPAGSPIIGNYDMTIDGTTMTKTLSLPASTYYAFKIVYNSDFYGNTGTMETKNHTDWTMSTGADDCGINTTVAGDYTFIFNTSNKKLTVIYPPEVYLAADPASVYSGGTTTLTASSWNITSGKAIKYEFFAGNTATGAAISTQNLITSGTEHSTTYAVTPTFAGNEMYKDYTVKITFDGKTATSTVRVYRKWDIYVHDTESWGGMYNYLWTNSGAEYASWPGVDCPKYGDNATWYVVTLDAKYDKFQLNCNKCDGNKRTFGGDGAYANNITTFPVGSYWYLTYDNTGGDGYKYYTLGSIVPTLPTVTLSSGLRTTTAIELIGYMDNCGGDGTTAAEMKDVYFTVNGVRHEAQCKSGGYFYLTLTGLTPGTTYTVTASATNIIGTSTTASQSIQTRSGTTLVKVKNEMNWLELNLYAYADTGNDCGEADIHIQHDYEMTPLGYDSWYYAYVSNDYTHFKVNNGTDWTEVGKEIEEDCYTNKYNGVNKTLGKITCPSVDIYQVEIVDGTNTYHSNTVVNKNDILSFYAQKDATITLIHFNGTSVNRYNISSLFSAYTKGDVVTADVNSAGTSLENIARYTGSYYVRTDGSTGTWNDYKDGNKTMYAFDNNELYPNEYYNHYWCAYLSPGVNVKAQVANDYNENLSVTLPNYNLSRQDGSKAYEGTNVRFAYNNENNLFEVQFLRAASGNFLFLYGYAEGGVAANNYVYNSADLAQKIDLEHAMSFSDLSDWMYQADFYINMPDGKHSAQIVIMSNYYLNDYNHAAKHINLGSPDPDSTDPFMVTGDNITKGKYLIRVIYDYKTNRIVAAWLPNGDNLFQGALDANMMIVRTNDLDAKTIGNPSTNKTLTNVHRIYGVLEIDSLDYFSRPSHFYWISLPFDVKVKDVFGIDGYNSKWQIQRYRGDLRAQSGYQPGHTYWRVMNNASDNAIMEANRGYVVYLNLNKSDFKSVSYLDGTGTTKYKSAKRLFFPSNNTSDYTLSYTAGANRTSTLGTYICEVSDSDGSRKNKDSNWNVAGVPGYNKHKITRATTSDDLLMEPPKYYYAWTWNGSKDANNYVATAVTNETVFKPFEAYMFQYGGTLTWSPDVATSAASSPARREIMAQHNVSEQLLQINLEADYEWLDNALITLSDKQSVTGDFDLNGDLSKIMNSGSQIYSFAGKERVAGNLVPDTQDTVQLGVVIDAEATYTFHLDNMPGNYTIYLYDNETRQRTCLNHGDYDVILAAGTYDQRFVVEIAHAPSVVTDIDYASGSYLSVVEHDGRLYIEGINDGAELRLYDMTGRLLTACRYSSGEGIAAPASGVYMLSTNGVSKKIIVNHQP